MNENSKIAEERAKNEMKQMVIKENRVLYLYEYE